MAAYVAKARSAFYPHAAGNAKVKAHLTYDLFQMAYKADPIAGRTWISRLADISDAAIADVINEVPGHLMSAVAREFTAKLLRANMDRLIG